MQKETSLAMFGFCIAVFLPWLVFTSTVHKPKHFLTCSLLHSFDSKDEKRIQYVSPEPEGTGHRDFPKKCKIWDQIQSPVFAFFFEKICPQLETGTTEEFATEHLI